MPHPLWQSLAHDAGMKLSEEQLAQLDRYLDLVIEWNEKINLTRIVDRADAEVKHIADALTLLRLLPKGLVTLADVGTGGGVPGVPIAICRPDIMVTLIDSTKKKLDTIQKIVDAIGLKNVTMLHTRIEQVKAKYDVITARAVADLDTLLQWTWPLMKPASRLLAMKGPKASEEIEAAKRRLFHQKRSATIEPVNVPELNGHCIVRIG